jgi:YD repeat-containing protein
MPAMDRRSLVGLAAIGVAVCAVLLYAAPAAAQVYKHVDDQGNVTFTNVPTTSGYELQSYDSSPVARGGSVPEPSEPKAPTGPGETTSYEYDRGGRLSGVKRGGTTTDYQYDANNNLVRKRRSDGQTTVYDVGPKNQVRGMTVYHGRR